MEEHPSGQHYEYLHEVGYEHLISLSARDSLDQGQGSYSYSPNVCIDYSVQAVAYLPIEWLLLVCQLSNTSATIPIRTP